MQHLTLWLTVTYGGSLRFYHMLIHTNHNKARGERHGNCNLNPQLAARQIGCIVNKGRAIVLVHAEVQSPLREHLVDGTAYHQADKRHSSCTQQ